MQLQVMKGCMQYLQAPMSRLETGTFINDRYAAMEERLSIVRKRLNRPLSFAEKVPSTMPGFFFCRLMRSSLSLT